MDKNLDNSGYISENKLERMIRERQDIEQVMTRGLGSVVYRPVPEMPQGPAPALFCNEGDEIEFTNVDKKYISNYSYEINGVSGWSLWYSQLAVLYLLNSEGETKTTTFLMKGNWSVTPGNENPESLWGKIRGKKFKVKSRTKAFWPVNELLREYGREKVDLLYSKICRDIAQGKHEFDNALRQGSVYVFEEI